jgi:hypothetical protein
MAGDRLEVSDGADVSGWSEPAANNAPAEDGAVEAVFRMNQKHILPARITNFFQPLLCPKKFPYLPLPPSHLPAPSYLLVYFALIPSLAQESLKRE